MKEIYFIITLDGYNQPLGNIEEIELTKEEYEYAKKNYVYIYKTKKEAQNSLDWHIQQ